jgi:hypothetical protein
MDELRQTSSQLNHAVQGLNELMEEALRIAGQAAHQGRPGEIAAIFDDATAHLRQATVTQKQPRRRQHHSTDELRYVQEKSGKSEMPVGPPEAHLPASRRGQPIRWIARDCYRDPAEHHHLGLPAALSRAHLPTGHTVRPNQPTRRYARPRLDDPVELHYRSFPIRAQQYLRDERRPERTQTKAFDISGRQLPVAPIVQPVPPAESAPSPPPESSSSSSHGSSNATTIGPDDLDLKHPRKRHISIPANQKLSLGRHHRQPIAREWPTYKKRITAMIACLNTVFIGLIVGIYVSSIMSWNEQDDNADSCRRARCRGFSTRSRTRIIELSWATFCKPQLLQNYQVSSSRLIKV